MATVTTPSLQRKPSGIGQLLQIGGAVAGGVVGFAGGGGPAGAIGGASAGGALGGAAGNLLEPDKAPVQVGTLNAAQRMSQGGAAPTIQAPNPLQQLEQARMAARELPAEQRQEYEPALVAALMQARRQQGVA